MNERIRELAISGGIYDCICDPYDKLKNGDPYSSVMLDLERFAELIVRECAGICDSYGMPDGTSQTATILSMAIKNRFGVK